MTKPSDILKKARALITEPSKWTTGDFAKDSDGDSTSSKSETAVCWCTAGAIAKVSDTTDCLYNEEGVVLISILDLHLMALDYVVQAGRIIADTNNTLFFSIITFNDTRSHDEVLSLFDKAIELAVEAND